jgi:hypothetical protein
MTAHARLWWLTATLVTMAACGGGTPAPSAPSAPQSFLSGTWSGTLTIEREGRGHQSADVSRDHSIAASLAPDHHDRYRRHYALEQPAGTAQHAGRLRLAAGMHRHAVERRHSRCAEH